MSTQMRAERAAASAAECKKKKKKKKMAEWPRLFGFSFVGTDVKV
jgi:hypothetical protein